MATYEHIGDHEERMLSKVLSQYRTKPRLCALARSLGAAVQQVEDAFAPLSSDVLFCNATGARLDLYGAWVNEPRVGLTDIEYRRVIAARVLANRCQGTEDEMWGILTTLIPEDVAEEVYLTALYPASIYARVRTRWRPDVQYVRRVGAILRLAKPAGVSLGGAWAVDVAYGFDGNPATLGLDQGQLAYGL